jgi:hypothetical protein
MGITLQPSDGSGSGAPEAPLQFKAYSVAEQAFVQLSVTRAPSGAKMAPSAATPPPLGTSQIWKAARGVQPEPLASLNVSALVGH